VPPDARTTASGATGTTPRAIDARWGVHVPAAAATAALAVAALRLLWASRGWPLIHDAPLMHYVAWRLAEGATPYRDLFDMNFPAVYLAHWLVRATLGPGDLAFRVFDLAVLGVTAAGLVVGLRTVGPWGGAVAAALFALYHVAGGAWLAGQRELLLCGALAWTAGGVLVALRTADAGRAAPLGLAALALGAGVWVKPHAAVLAPLLLALAWRGPARPRAVALVTAGLVAPAAAMLGWLAMTGALGAFADIVLGYLGPLYSRLGRTALLPELAARDYGGPVLAGLAGWGILGAAALARPGRRGVLGVLATGLGYGLLHFWAQGRGWEYHFYPAALFAVALGAAGLGAAVRDGRRALAAALALVLLVTTGALRAKGWRNLDPEWNRRKTARVERLVASLRPVVAAGGLVQVLDTTEGGIHALYRLGARQPTRFLYDFHFYHDVDHPYVRRLRGELLEGLRARPPGAVVLFETGWPSGGYERLDAFPELARWLRHGYRLRDEGDGYRLYVPQPGSAPGPAAGRG
jgi:hypothetical protein